MVDILQTPQQIDLDTGNKKAKLDSSETNSQSQQELDLRVTGTRTGLGENVVRKFASTNKRQRLSPPQLEEQEEESGGTVGSTDSLVNRGNDDNNNRGSSVTSSGDARGSLDGRDYANEEDEGEDGDQTSSRECHQVGGEMPSEASGDEEEEPGNTDNSAIHAAMKGFIGAGSGNPPHDLFIGNNAQELLNSYYQSISAAVGRPPLGFPPSIVLQPGMPHSMAQTGFPLPGSGLTQAQAVAAFANGAGAAGNGAAGMPGMSARDHQLLAQQRDFLLAAQHQFLAREALLRGGQPDTMLSGCKTPPPPGMLFPPPNEHSTPASRGHVGMNAVGRQIGGHKSLRGEDEEGEPEDEGDENRDMFDEDDDEDGLLARGDLCSEGKDDEGTGSNGHQWTFEEQFKQLYELSDEAKRKEFLDDLFSFMQKRGTPVNRIPIMAKQVLDLYELFRLVASKGGLVEVINKKLWREITKGLNLPSSITSAAFTLRTQYMKYLYPYECETLKLSSPSELQAAIDGNRREARRPSYSFEYPMMPGLASQVCGPLGHPGGMPQVSQAAPPPSVSLSALFAAHCQGAPHGFPGLPGMPNGGLGMLPGKPLPAPGNLSRSHSAIKDFSKVEPNNKNIHDRLSPNSPTSCTPSSTPLSPPLLHTAGSGTPKPPSLPASCPPPPTLPPGLFAPPPTSSMAALFPEFPSSLVFPPQASMAPPAIHNSPSSLSPLGTVSQRQQNNSLSLKRRHDNSQSETSPVSGASGSTSWNDSQKSRGDSKTSIQGSVPSSHAPLPSQLVTPQNAGLSMSALSNLANQRAGTATSVGNFFSPPSFSSINAPGSNLRMSTQPGSHLGMPDNTMVVSMDMNGLVYQGVLFAQQKRF